MEVDYAYAESPEGQSKFQNALMSILNDNRGIPGILSLIAPLTSNIIGLIVNMIIIVRFNVWIIVIPVSYTHLDVYKRQTNEGCNCSCW